MIRSPRLLTTVLLAACLPTLALAEAAAPPPPALPAVTVSIATTARLTDRILAGGFVQAVETVQVAPLVEGQPIAALLADVGDRVTAGQVLARLSPTTLELTRSQLAAGVAATRATVAQAEAQLIEVEAAAADAQRTLDRITTLHQRGNASQTALDQAQTGAVSATARVNVARQSLAAARAQADSAAAQLASVELSLTRTEVIAPVAGEVVARNATVGAIASAAGPAMFTLMRDGALELRVELTEGDLPRITPGLAVTLRIPGSPEPLAGTVRLVEPVIDPATRLGHARIDLADPGPLRSGMYAEAEIILADRTTLALPISAIGTGTDGAMVLRVDDAGNVRRTVIGTGIRDGGLVEVTAGLAPGDRVVAKAGAFVRDGDRITPVTGQE